MYKMTLFKLILGITSFLLITQGCVSENKRGSVSESKKEYYLIPYLKSNGKYIYVKPKTMEPIIMKEYDEVDFFSEDFGRVCNWVDGGKKYGFVNKNGVEVIPPKYHDARDFIDGLALVQLDANWGFVDKNGVEVIPPKYNYAENFNDEFALVKKNNKWGFIDKNGVEIIPLKYNNAGGFSDELAPVNINGKWGYIDKKGVEVIPFKFNGVGCFIDGLAPVKINEKWGYIDKNGVERISFKFNDAKKFINDITAVKFNQKWGLIDKEGDEISPMKYDTICEFVDNIAAVKINQKWGFIDLFGKEISPIKYDYVYDFKNNVARVNDGGKWIIIDKNGRNISFNTPEIFIENEKYGLKNKKGEIILYPKYDNIYEYENGLSTVIAYDEDGNSYAGLIDENGKEIITPKYTLSRFFLFFIFENNYAFVVENDKLFYVDKEGLEYREFKKSELDFLNEFEGQYALLDLKLLQHTIIKRRLIELLGEDYDYMNTYWSTEGPIKIVKDNFFYTGGFMAHNCCEPYFSLMADIKNDLLFVEITKENGSKKLYAERNAILPPIFKDDNFSNLD
jgi:hypothetical protein